MNPVPSWNASHLISNFSFYSSNGIPIIMRMPLNGLLDHYDESPQLPFSYPAKIMIALFPPLWFGIMNKRLERWQVANEMIPA